MVNAKTTVKWEAEEYIEQKHNTIWYVLVIVVGLLFCLLSVLLQMWTFIIVIVLMVILVILRAVMPPRKIKYSINFDNLTEGNQVHPLSEFKAFGILKEGEHYSAVLRPKKRFGFLVKVYFPEKNGEAIVDILGSRLPMEEVRLDFIDKLVKFLRI